MTAQVPQIPELTASRFRAANDYLGGGSDDFRPFDYTHIQKLSIPLDPYTGDYFITPQFQVMFVRRGSHLETLLLLAQ